MTQDSSPISVDSIREQIPYYLTQEQKENLAKALAGFPGKMDYYTLLHKDTMLQGDGWTPLQLVQFDTLERKGVRGIILSNSCDIAPENPRDVAVKLAFAPIVNLDRYTTRLQQAGLSDQSIGDKIKAIREQLITSLFFLPKGGDLESDHIAILDDIHSMPVNKFIGDESRQKIFTLSQAGFYLFLLKLSIHFCRFHEQVYRDTVA